MACPSQDDAEALPAIATKSQIPVIADIHFQPTNVYAAIEAAVPPCASTGNIRQFDDQVKQIARRPRTPASPSASGSTRAPSTSGSSRSTASRPPRPSWSRLCEASLFEEHDFHDFKISVKHNDPVVMVRAYEMLAERGDWPLHLGVIEPVLAFQGTTVGHRVRRAAVQGHR